MNPDNTPPIPNTPNNPTASESPLKQIRTFQGDIAEALDQQKTSVFSLQQQAHAKNAAVAKLAPENPEESSGQKKIILLIIGTIVLVGLGAGGAWYAYTQYKTKTALPTVVVVPNRFINVQNSLTIDTSTLTRDSLVAAVRAENAKSLAAGTVEEIQLNLHTENFLNLLQISTPGNLVRALDPLFMLGVLGSSINNPTGGLTHTFLIIKLDSFENAFPGMLAWEPTLANDLLPLFASDAEVQNVSVTSTFSDITIQNKDARILKDGNGHTVLLYSFYANNYLIVTDTEDSLRTLIGLLDSHTLSR
jgi:hypothetical protein